MKIRSAASKLGLGPHEFDLLIVGHVVDMERHLRDTFLIRAL